MTVGVGKKGLVMAGVFLWTYWKEPPEEIMHIISGSEHQRIQISLPFAKLAFELSSLSSKYYSTVLHLIALV